MTKHSLSMTKDEPSTTKDDPSTTKDGPSMTKDEPSMPKEKSAMVKEIPPLVMEMTPGFKIIGQMACSRAGDKQRRIGRPPKTLRLFSDGGALPRRRYAHAAEAFLAILAHHHGFKGVNVQATDLVFLFYLDGIPAFFQTKFVFLLLARSTSNQQPAMTAESVVSRALFIERIVDSNWGI